MLTPRLLILLATLVAVIVAIGPAVCSLVAEAQKAGVA